jgi:hypothetical protein
MRTGVARYEIGSKITTQWGYEASTIDLKDKSSLANHIAQDVIPTPRQRGYRGVPARGSGAGAADVALALRVHVFSLIVSEGDRMKNDVTAGVASSKRHRKSQVHGHGSYRAPSYRTNPKA